MKIFLFLGSRRGFAILKKLCELNAEICGILCLIEDAHEEIYHTQITSIAQEKNIPIFYSNKIKPSQYTEIVKNCDPEITFVIGWRFLIHQSTYELPPKGTLVIHDSLLPKYRGFAPMNWAIINGETETGVTLFFMDATVDSGPIVAQLKTTITDDDTALSLDQKIIALYEKIIEENLQNLATGHYQTTLQNEVEASYTCKRIPEDSLINWHQSAQHIHNLVRASSKPFSGAYTYLHQKRVTIWQTKLPKQKLMYVGNIPGRILGKKNNYLEVLTGDGILLIESLQILDESIIKALDLPISVKDTFSNGHYPAD